MVWRKITVAHWQSFPIGSVMKLTDLTARQINYYEDRKGWISPDRTEGNRRMYSIGWYGPLAWDQGISDGLNIADIKRDMRKRARANQGEGQPEAIRKALHRDILQASHFTSSPSPYGNSLIIS